MPTLQILWLWLDKLHYDEPIEELFNLVGTQSDGLNFDNHQNCTDDLK
jgi:hypothetical protein